MSEAELAFALVCASWSGLTLYVNISPSPGLVRRDVLMLVPSYRFFAPRPKCIDRFLEYRLKSFDGSTGPWQPIELHRRRTWRSMWWNPHHLAPALLVDWAERLLHVMARPGQQSAVPSLAYQEVLAFVRQRPEVAGAAAVQFQLLTGRAHDPDARPTMAFRSEWHGPSA